MTIALDILGGPEAPGFEVHLHAAHEVMAMDRGHGITGQQIAHPGGQRILAGSWPVQGGMPASQGRAAFLDGPGFLVRHVIDDPAEGVERLHVAPTGRRKADQGEGEVALRAPGDLSRFIAPKGSIAIEGVSLTVNEVDGAMFGVNIIPHTAAHTTFGTLQPGDSVNIEIDMLARYVARLRETSL